MHKEVGSLRIGVLSIQGDVIEHISHIAALGYTPVEVKKSAQLEGLNGLILPGGESTAISKILIQQDMLCPIREKILDGLPVWGTCAGMILLAKELEDDKNAYLAVMDIKVRRNAYGGQLDSFQVNEVIEEISTEPLPLIFIRAPYITSVGDKAKVLHKTNGNIVVARQGNMLATSFHPELTNNLELHKYFASMCLEKIDE